MEKLSNLYGIFGQNNGQHYANENENEHHLPEFLQSVNNGSSSLNEFNLQNEEFGQNFHLDFSSLFSSSLLSLGHFQPELPQPLQDITSSSNQTASCPDLVDETRFPVVPQEEINKICESREKEFR